MAELIKGLFRSNLYRNNKQIRDDRGNVIVRGAEMAYKRFIEDLEMEIEQRKLEQSKLTDINPSSKNSLDFSTFNASSFAADDAKLCKEIYMNEKLLEIYKERYNALFVAEAKLEPINED
jgi:hypothetical protein